MKFAITLILGTIFLTLALICTVWPRHVRDYVLRNYQKGSAIAYNDETPAKLFLAGSIWYYRAMGLIALLFSDLPGKTDTVPSPFRRARFRISKDTFKTNASITRPRRSKTNSGSCSNCTELTTTSDTYSGDRGDATRRRTFFWTTVG